MEKSRNRLRSYACAIAVVALAATVAACAAPYQPPTQIQQNNAGVTFKYRTDQELVQTGQSAAAYCERHSAAARAASFRNDADGSKVVAYECLPLTAAQTQYAPVMPGMSYTYRSDQELLDGSRNAQAYCAANGQQQAVSNITQSMNGVRMVTYQCMPR